MTWLSKQLARPTGDALVSSVRELLGWRVHPDHIARRMGRPSVSALIRALQRLGANGLANELRDPLADQARKAAPVTRQAVRGKQHT
jgi:hypothetical protein